MDSSIYLYSGMQEAKEFKELKKPKKFMSRNVTEFRHLIKNCYTTENDLNWVINLRDNNIKNIEKKPDATPDVFFKQTKSAEFKIRKKHQRSQQKLKPNDYDQFFLRGYDHAHQTENQLEFYSSLRKENWLSETSKNQSQKDFVTIPFKERRSSTKFIKKDCIKKIKDISEGDFESGLDGAHRQDRYTEKIVKMKNYASLATFTRLRGRNKVSLPSLAWQMGLRDY